MRVPSKVKQTTQEQFPLGKKIFEEKAVWLGTIDSIEMNKQGHEKKMEWGRGFFKIVISRKAHIHIYQSLLIYNTESIEESESIEATL